MHTNNAVGCSVSLHMTFKATLYSVHLSLCLPCSCFHSLSFVPYSPSSQSCSNWMCSHRNSLLLSRAIQHMQHSAQIDVVQYPTALFDSVGKKTHICSLRVYNKHRTRHSAPFTFKPIYSIQNLSAGSLWKHECLSKENCLLDQACLSLYVFSAWVWWSGQMNLIDGEKKKKRRDWSFGWNAYMN